MQIVIEGETAAVLERLVAPGRFPSPRAALEDALRQPDEEQQRKLAWMRARAQDALDKGGECTLEDLDRDMGALPRRLEKELR